LLFYCRRAKETPKRPPAIFALDVSKQAAGMLAAHACGLSIAMLIHVKATHASECAWYLVVYAMDTSLGVFFSILMYRALVKYAVQRLARRTSQSETELLAWAGVQSPPIATKQSSWMAAAVASSGAYGDPVNVKWWVVQTAGWVSCVVLARVGCGTIAFLASPLAESLAAVLDAAFKGHPTVLLFTVMVCGPLALNTAQVLVQDAALQSKQSVGADEGSF
jgi:hypothetical protein